MKHFPSSNRRHFSLCLVTALSFGHVGALQAQGKPAPLVLVVGDSLSAEYGLRRGSGWGRCSSSTGRRWW
jgi:acyl-CoA thioesterase-1